MKDGKLRVELESMAPKESLIGCALVYLVTGMIWPTVGRAKNQQRSAEAASDYWGLYKRQRTHVDYSSTLLITLSEDIALFDWNAPRQKVLAHVNRLSKS
jgi:hypothetical protein